MSRPRESRLKKEFERMMAIRKEGGLIQFACASLSDEEAIHYMAAQMPTSVVEEAIAGFMSPEQFQEEFPGRYPEKYLITFRCIGLLKDQQGQIKETDRHALLAVFGHDFLARPARFVWLTPIWHPNINQPHLCAEGRPLGISITLDLICTMVGQMVQYRIYNVDDPLNKEAAQWAAENRRLFPVDTRGLLDGSQQSRPLVTLVADELKDWGEPQKATGSSAVVELL